MTISVFAPISIGNVSVGFDTLGLAVKPIDNSLVGDIVTITGLDDAAKENEFELVGDYVDKLPKDKENNIAWRCLLAFETKLRTLKIQPVRVKLTLRKEIPVSSGLGSSGCSVVASLMALNEFYQKPLDDEKLLKLMGALELQISGSLHYDNVAPSFLGGMQLMLPDNEKIAQTLPVIQDCYWLIAYPDVEVSTKAAREILPKSYDRQTLIAFGQNLAGFVDACHRKDKSQAFSLLKDVVAEPFRKSLLPAFDDAKKRLIQLGCLAVGISGSGPTLFSVCDNEDIARRARDWLQEHYLQSPNGFVYICRADQRGARRI